MNFFGLILASVTAIIFIGCNGKSDKQNSANSQNSQRQTSSEHPLRAPKHEAEKVAFELVDAIRNGKYSKNRFDFGADADLPSDKRTTVFRRLESFLKSQKWRLRFTEIGVLRGEEDDAEVFFIGNKGDLFVLFVGYHYDTKDWRVNAYESPQRTFARPKGETYSEYMSREIAEAKRECKPYVPGKKADGKYSIEY